MREETGTLLMESVVANRLSVLCGAGLSMASPSKIPGAARVAEICRERYRTNVGSEIPTAVANDIETMAVHFRATNRFKSLFINSLVPWELFETQPNAGHHAIADLLACHAAREAVTTNYDGLVESSAQMLGERLFRPIADVEDLGFAVEHKPYLKVHGCLRRTLSHTIWCKEQFEDEPLKTRARRFREWLAANLIGRDLLIVGFWTDWKYLSEVFADSLPAIGECAIIVVDLGSAADLEAKAPKLWQWTHGAGIRFVHEQESGADFLESFRKHFSSVVIKRFLDAAEPVYRQLFGGPPLGRARDFVGWTSSSFYELRRDLTGKARDRAVRDSIPQPRFENHVAFHERLMDKGAAYDSGAYTFGPDRLRLVSGHGELLSRVKARYANEPPLPIPGHKVVCIGAINDTSAVSIVRPDPIPGVVRGGAGATWLTEQDLLPVLRAAV